MLEMMMDLLHSLLEAWARTRRRIGYGAVPVTQSPDCIILQQPVDILHLILEYLPEPSRIILGQTCRVMRSMTRNVVVAKQLSDHDHLEYLACIVRNLPDKWLCSGCREMHQACRGDLPQSSWARSCPIEWLADLLNHEYCGHRLYAIHHRHVQLALKLTRLRDGASSRNINYLERLMAPYRSEFYTHPALENLQGRYEAYPKIVNGRFMTHSIWRYTSEGGMHNPSAQLSTYTFGFLKICPHLMHYNESPHSYTYIADTMLYGLRRLDSHDRLETGQIALDQFIRNEPAKVCGETLSKVIDKSLSQRDEEIFGSCSACLTDFSIHAHLGCIMVRAWQDLGPECSPEDVAWRSQVTGRKCHGDDRTLIHVPGSVRFRYTGNAEKRHYITE